MADFSRVVDDGNAQKRHSGTAWPTGQTGLSETLRQVERNDLSWPMAVCLLLGAKQVKQTPNRQSFRQRPTQSGLSRLAARGPTLVDFSLTRCRRARRETGPSGRDRPGRCQARKVTQAGRALSKATSTQRLVPSRSGGRGDGRHARLSFRGTAKPTQRSRDTRRVLIEQRQQP